MLLFNILYYTLLIYLAWSVLYQLSFSIAGYFFRKKKEEKQPHFYSFEVLIPSYKEDAVIVETARQATQADYPKDKYHVTVIADKLQAETVAALKALPIRVLVPDFGENKSTKSKSLNLALAQLDEQPDAVAILDADNLMDKNFLQQMNQTLNEGHLAIQGSREAKNRDTSMAQLDGASEAINNHILCAGHRALGLSARLAGSGMAFEFNIFAKVMNTIDALGGFDKELELKLTQNGIIIAYNPDAIVLDEKIKKADNFARQRGRWLAAQYRYGRRFIGKGVKALLTRGKLDFFNKSLQMALPPRLVLPIFLAMGTLVTLLLGTATAWVWASLLVANVISFLLALPREAWSISFLKALLHIPKAFFATLKALTLMRLAGKQFLHTPHS
jgi:cellulose synthase/poly-beta-1,6-N-acetylglucosamine synthase-like glycosyltransferase